MFANYYKNHYLKLTDNNSGYYVIIDLPGDYNNDKYISILVDGTGYTEIYNKENIGATRELGSERFPSSSSQVSDFIYFG